MEQSKNRNRELIGQLVNKHALSVDAIRDAEHALDTEVSNSAWLSHIKFIMQWVSAALLGVGAVFFVAANWHGLTNFQKFTIIQIPFAVAIGLYVWLANPIAKKAALLVSFINIGAAFALFGQVFQTGADPWQLFFNWALLGLPLVFISRSSALYLAWAGVLNLALHFYADIYFENTLTSLLIVGVNGVLLALWEVKCKYSAWIANNLVSNLLATYLVFNSVICFCYGMFIARSFAHLMMALPLLVCLLLYVYYRIVNENLFVLMLVAVFSTIAVNAVFINLLDSGHTTIGYLTSVFITAGMGWFWLLHIKSLYRETAKKGVCK